MSTKDSSDNARLAPFLRYLADSLEKNTLSPEQTQRIGEFFMSYLFAEEVKNDVEPPEDDFKKFVVLGWYVYKQILNDNPLEGGEVVRKVPEQESATKV